MTVRRLLAIVFGVIVISMLIRGWAISKALGTIHAQARAANEAASADIDAIGRATRLAMDLEAGVLGFALTFERDAREPYDRAIRERELVLSLLSARISGSVEGRQIAEQLTRELGNWDLNVAQPLLGAAAKDGALDANRALHRDGRLRMSVIRDLLDRAREVTAAELIDRLGALEARRNSVATEYASAFVAYMLVLVLAWLATTRYIDRPLAQLAQYVDRKADEPPPRVRGVREVERLAEALTAMTERLEARRALLDTTVGSIAEAVAVYDDQDVCVLANPAARSLLGFDPTGKKEEGIATRVDSTPVDGPMPPRMSSLGTLHRIKNDGGDTKTVSVNVAMLPTGGRVVSARDITHEHELREQLANLNEELQSQNEELVAQEEELRAQSDELTARNLALMEASRTKTQFLATMSHELRTPLNAVIGFSEILLDGTYGPVLEKQATGLHHIHDAGRHLLMLIDDLLDLSKVEAGQISLSMGTVDVAGAITEAVTLVTGAAEKKQIRLDVAIPPQLSVRADRARVRQIALNLLSNAIKFTPEGGTVACTASVTGNRVRIAVRDTGIGISASDSDKLFKPFSQIDSGDRRRYGGTGLGLVISRHLVEVMEGTIGYSSEKGVGSTFWFDLPVATRASSTSGQLPAVANKKPTSPPRVLVVEDSATDATMLETSLAQAGYEVRVVRDAELALQALSGFQPALAIVDLALPGMSGFALIEQLRADPRYQSLAIAVLTGRDVDGEERVLLESHVQFVARKGLPSRSEFLARIASIVPPADTAARKPLVLVIDDNDVNRSVACAMVEALGFEALDANDAASGIDLARERQPAVVLMDIEMPVMNGIEATRILGSDPKTAMIPVIALTAHAMAGDAERFLEAGCSDYVSKPFGRSALRRALGRALGMDDG